MQVQPLRPCLFQHLVILPVQLSIVTYLQYLFLASILVCINNTTNQKESLANIPFDTNYRNHWSDEHAFQQQ